LINNIEQKIIKFIDEKDLIQKNDRILIALSGGPDSVFLLHFLNKYKKRFKIELGAVHINHLLRGDESDKDEVFCRKICNELGLEYFSVRKNVKSFALKEKISLEEAGREIRYQVFESTAFKHKYNKIATAHNSNDNAETVLLNLIKGTGIKGISGIASKRNNIIRPVIKLTKDEILTYLNQKEISFRIDKSNLSSDYERNFLRNEIIPLIKKRLNPKLEDSLFNSTEVFKKISRKIDRETERFISTVKFRKKENLLELFPDKLKDLEEEFLGDFIKEAVKRNFSIQLSFNDVNKITLLFHAKTGKKINLSENLSAVKERKQILIFINSDKEEFSFDKKIILNSSVKLEGKIIHIDRVLSSEVELSGDKNVEYISGDRCGENFRLRTWKEGDRFFPLGFNLKKGRTGSKKISDFLNEQKIPSILKKKQLVLTTQNNIVWVLGLRLDDRFKLTEKTKKIYRLCLK
jgi:tRNA(Ile)-lysidine synthase